MSYSIRYGQDMKQEIQLKSKARKNIVYLTSGICLVMLGVIWPEVRDCARQILFPWLNESTVVAFSNMIGQIGDGAAVSTALVDFCRNLINNAGSPV